MTRTHNPAWALLCLCRNLLTLDALLVSDSINTVSVHIERNSINKHFTCDQNRWPCLSSAMPSQGLAEIRCAIDTTCLRLYTHKVSVHEKRAQSIEKYFTSDQFRWPFLSSATPSQGLCGIRCTIDTTCLRLYTHKVSVHIETHTVNTLPPTSSIDSSWALPRLCRGFLGLEVPWTSLVSDSIHTRLVYT